MMLRSAARVAWTLLGCLLLARSLRAEPPAPPGREEADRHFQQGLALAREERYQQALSEFLQAYETAPHFAVLYNIGQLHAQLGSPARAVAALKQYLARGSDEVSQARRQEVERLIARQQELCGNVELELTQKAVRVYLDGQRLDTLPDSPLPLDPGVHRLLFTKPGFALAERRIVVSAGDHQRVSVALKQLPGPPRGALRIDCARRGVEVLVDGKPRGHTPFRAPLELPKGKHAVEFLENGRVVRRQSVQTASSSTVSCGLAPIPPSRNVVPQPLPSAVEGREGRATARRHWAYILGGTGLALAATAATSLVVGQSKHKTYTAKQRELNTRLDLGQTDEEWHQEYRDNQERLVQVHALDLVAMGCGVGATAVLTGAGVLFFGGSSPTPTVASNALPPFGIRWGASW